jgi:site-specific recombinase XerD
MTLDQTIRQFLDHQLANGRSPHTIGAQQRDLNLLLRHLDSDYNIREITSTDVDGFFLSSSVTKQSNGHPKLTSSINRTRASIKGFFRWLTDTGQIDHNPAIGIQIKHKNRKPPVFLIEEEKRGLLKTIRSQKGWQANRDLVIVNLFLHTGIRLSELVGLDITDVNLMEKKITIQAKGGQIVNRFLNTKLRTILHRYLKERKQVFTDSQALFLSQLQQRIATRQIQRRLDQWIVKAGISKRITPHSLRHSFATGLYARTSNILVVQQALGHASVSTTEIYAHLFDEALEEALETL